MREIKNYWLDEVLEKLSKREFDLRDFDFELDSIPKVQSNKKPETLCGKLGRKHRMKRISSMMTYCIYPGCDGHC